MHAAAPTMLLDITLFDFSSPSVHRVLNGIYTLCDWLLVMLCICPPPRHATTVLWPFSGTTFVSDIAIFVLKRDVKLQPANFPAPPGWAGARRELLDFIVHGKINRGRHTDHPAERHSVRINQCPPPPSPHIFTGWMPFLPPNQQCQSTEGS